MSAVIAGIGTAIPGVTEPTEYLIEHAKNFSCRSAKQERVLSELYRRTEIKQRASVLATRGHDRAVLFATPLNEDDRGPGTAERMNRYRLEAAPLAVTAAQRALCAAGTEAAEVTHLVTVSCTGFHAPGFDIDLINTLGLRPDTLRTHVGFMGCHGAMNGLRVASAFVQADSSAVVMLCAAELCSLHFQYGWGADQLLANSLFADGAAALVVRCAAANRQAGSTVAAYHSVTFHHVDSTSYLIADTGDAMVWSVGNHGFQMSLSSQVPAIVACHLPTLLASWLAKHALSIADIAGWAVHPGGPRILDAVAESLALPPERLSDSRAVLSECGNMSSPTILFILERLAVRNLNGPCIVLGFGPGLTIEAALLTR